MHQTPGVRNHNHSSPPRSHQFPHSLSPLAALAAARAAAADTTINIRTYSVADSFTSDLLGLLGPIEENKSNSRSINYFREFRLNIKSENKLYAGV